MPFNDLPKPFATFVLEIQTSSVFLDPTVAFRTFLHFERFSRFLARCITFYHCLLSSACLLASLYPQNQLSLIHGVVNFSVFLFLFTLLWSIFLFGGAGAIQLSSQIPKLLCFEISGNNHDLSRYMVLFMTFLHFLHFLVLFSLHVLPYQLLSLSSLFCFSFGISLSSVSIFTYLWRTFSLILLLCLCYVLSSFSAVLVTFKCRSRAPLFSLFERDHVRS